MKYMCDTCYKLMTASQTIVTGGDGHNYLCKVCYDDQYGDED